MQLDNFGVNVIWASRHDLQNGSKKDLRAIWDAMAATSCGRYSVQNVYEVPSLKGFNSTIELFWDSEEGKEKRWTYFHLMFDKHPKQWPQDLKKFFEVEVDEEGQDDDQDL